jgi:nitric oxide reductase NorQ protein
MIEELAQHYIAAEPYYLAIGNEIEIAETAYRHGLPLLLKGPTGCGKTRIDVE